MKLLLILLIALISHQITAQDIAGCESVSLKTKADIKASEPCIKQLSTFALAQPMTGSSEEGHYARKVVYAWIEKTPDYSFSLNKKIMKIFNGDNLLLFTTYTVCLANAALSKGNNFEKYGLELFVKYIRNPENKVHQSKLVLKLISDWDNSKVSKYLE